MRGAEPGAVKKPTDYRLSLMDEIQQERANQIAQWGGQDHDDTHSDFDWFRFVFYQMNKLLNNHTNPSDFRSRMIKIAALAYAAVESHDRKTKNS